LVKKNGQKEMVMIETKGLALQQALDAADHLPFEDQETLIELLQRRFLEKRRLEIARHGRETIRAVREGRAKYGNIDDLKKDLLGKL
jgi:hypothetical protein